MKYVVRQYQSVLINGSIALSGTKYDKNYSHEEIIIQKGFLQLEHTDGLNYVNADFRRLDELVSWKFISLNITEVAGVGFLVPRTDASLLNFDRNDKFHIAGYGLNAMLSLNIRFGKNFFIQSEYKMGYISMQDIRTSKYREDFASQNFLFHQYNVVFGSHFRL